MNKTEVIFLNKDDFELLNKEKFAGLSGFFGKKSFLQSSFWASIQESYGRKCFYLSIKEGDNILALSMVIEISFLFGKLKYWYFPRGPIFKEGLDTEIKKNILLTLKKVAEEKKIIFFRLEFADHFLSRNKLFIKTRDIQPAKTSFVNLNKNLGDILGEMKQKTRYNIKLAEKKGVKIVEQTDKEKAFYNFSALIKQTSIRDNFSIHDDAYYRNLINSDNKIKVFEAYYQNQVVASGIFSFYENCVTYLHGASSDVCRNVMAPYLLHFFLISFSKENGFSFYDFYGVDESKWPGVSRFKKGFGGEEFEYPGTFDLPINNFIYQIYKTVRFLRRLFF